MALTEKIKCFGIKPKKSEIYKLAAELVELEQITGFYTAVTEAFKSNDYDYDYDYDDYDYDYYDYDDYDYDYYYYYYYGYYDYDYYYDYYSSEQKVIALLFLSAMYESIGE